VKKGECIICGLAGYIGQSKNPELTNQLITNLLVNSESRGIDATGFWGVAGERILYHKEPIRAAKFIRRQIWQEALGYQPNLLLAHARGASRGSGDPLINKNNHPFTNYNKSIGLVHNGKIDDIEYHNLRKKYALKSQCDSEILLRIFESASYTRNDNFKYSKQISGIQDIYSLISRGHMAVAIGEKNIKGNKILWLFRNQYRPLWAIDVREQLGQIFFVSEPNIWNTSVAGCCQHEIIFNSQKMVEIPTEEIWMFETNQENSIFLEKFAISVDYNNFSLWSDSPQVTLPIEFAKQEQILTGLDKEDVVLNNNAQDYKNFDLICGSLIKRINEIRKLTKKNILEDNDFEQLMAELESQLETLDKVNLLLS
jgi:glucosamine 6-phosphate synthetase-like amidotransferase/phosphosugar isomerase protein